MVKKKCRPKQEPTVPIRMQMKEEIRTKDGMKREMKIGQAEMKDTLSAILKDAKSWKRRE
jgi:hypothetical protein